MLDSPRMSALGTFVCDSSRAVTAEVKWHPEGASLWKIGFGITIIVTEMGHLQRVGEAIKVYETVAGAKPIEKIGRLETRQVDIFGYQRRNTLNGEPG